ncbi:MAG: hypothetical protein H8E46_11540 [FCB group bacterium]|nr:hypothetical protein [FCB group bacterium]
MKKLVYLLIFMTSLTILLPQKAECKEEKKQIPNKILVVGFHPVIGFSLLFGKLPQEISDAMDPDNWFVEDVNDSLRQKLANDSGGCTIIDYDKAIKKLNTKRKKYLLDSLKAETNKNIKRVFTGNFSLKTENINFSAITEICDVLDIDGVMFGIISLYPVKAGVNAPNNVPTLTVKLISNVFIVNRNQEIAWQAKKTIETYPLCGYVEADFVVNSVRWHGFYMLNRACEYYSASFLKVGRKLKKIKVRKMPFLIISEDAVQFGLNPLPTPGSKRVIITIFNYKGEQIFREVSLGNRIKWELENDLDPGYYKLVVEQYGVDTYYFCLQ